VVTIRDSRAARRTKQEPGDRQQGKGVYRLNFRFPQFARTSIPLPKRRNDPISQTPDRCSVFTLIEGAWSIFPEIFPSTDFDSAVFKEEGKNPVNISPNRGVTAPAATVMVKRMMATFAQLRFT
jgi:hypothetical protein